MRSSIGGKLNRGNWILRRCNCIIFYTDQAAKAAFAEVASAIVLITNLSISI